MQSDYLTEKSLGNYLQLLFNDTFIHNKVVPGSNSKCRPDYRNDVLMLIVEFNGYTHYNSTKQIIRDYNITQTYIDLGYTVVDIPYFVQMSKDVTHILFNKYANILNYIEYSTYPHGFIDIKAMLPCDFNILGIERFKNDLKRFEVISNEIKQSLMSNSIMQAINISEYI